jgi:hypothetical protein
LTVLGAVALAYFVAYPEDLAAVLAPAQRVLGLSSAVSPWLYGLLAVALACRTADRIWGRGALATRDQDTSHR